MARAKLDRIDRRILSDLQANGRMTNVELAERAGISAPPCLQYVVLAADTMRKSLSYRHKYGSATSTLRVEEGIMMSCRL